MNKLHDSHVAGYQGVGYTLTKQIRNTVRAAQLLQALGGTGGNPLDALLSFLEPVLSDFSGQEFSPYTFSAAVRDAYGWDFNEDVADGLRRTLRARGWLKQKKSEPSNLPVYVDGKPVEIVTYQRDLGTFIEPEEAIDEALDRILKAFHAFLSEINVDHSRFSRSDDEIIDTLISWLLDNGTSLAEIDDYLLTDHSNTDADQINYLIARFVQSLNESNAELSLQLRNIAAVGLLSELAQDFHKPLTSVKKSNLVVYLDSPIALDLIGASGDDTAELTRSIISKLQSIGASIAVFSSSVREMQSILDALLLADPNDRFGPSQEAIRRGEIDIAFLSSIRNDPENAFKPFRVKIRPIGFERALKPDHYFSEGNFGRLYDQLLSTQVNQREKEKRCRHDAQATAFVMRLRKGHVHSDLFESQSVFLTRNRMFSALSRTFCIRQDLMDDSCVGPMVNMHDLAASLWLRTGLHNEVDVPKRQLLVGCQRVLALRRPVIIQAQRAILSLKKSSTLSEERVRQIEAILGQDRSLTLISDRVRGARENLSEDTLIEVARTVMSDERQKGYFSGISDSAAEKAELARALGEARYHGIELKNKVHTLSEAISEFRSAEKRRIQSIVVRFNEWYTKTRDRVRVFLVLAAVILVILSIFKEASSTTFVASIFSTSITKWLIRAGALIPILITFVDQMWRITGHERPIDRFIVDPWARAKLRSLLEAAGFTMSDILVCSVPPQVPLERASLNDFAPAKPFEVPHRILDTGRESA